MKSLYGSDIKVSDLTVGDSVLWVQNARYDPDYLEVSGLTRTHVHRVTKCRVSISEKRFCEETAQNTKELGLYHTFDRETGEGLSALTYSGLGCIFPDTPYHRDLLLRENRTQYLEDTFLSSLRVAVRTGDENQARALLKLIQDFVATHIF